MLGLQMSPIGGIYTCPIPSMDGGDQFDLTVDIAHLEFFIQISKIFTQV